MRLLSKEFSQSIPQHWVRIPGRETDIWERLLPVVQKHLMLGQSLIGHPVAGEALRFAPASDLVPAAWSTVDQGSFRLDFNESLFAASESDPCIERVFEVLSLHICVDLERPFAQSQNCRINLSP